MATEEKDLITPEELVERLCRRDGRYRTPSVASNKPAAFPYPKTAVLVREVILHGGSIEVLPAYFADGTAHLRIRRAYNTPSVTSVDPEVWPYPKSPVMIRDAILRGDDVKSYRYYDLADLDAADISGTPTPT
jgi:hypothetical protein